MIDSAKILFQLLRAALGDETEFSLPNDVDWKELIDLSFDQGVAALSVDGLGFAHDSDDDNDNQERSDFSLDSPELEDLKYEWFGSCFENEQSFDEHLKVIEKLGSLYNEQSVRMLLLKGYGLSLNYPVPEHRTSGDIDIYLYGKGGLGDALVRERFGCEVKQNEDKHSVFALDGTSVENHATFTNVVEYPSHRQMEEFLQAEAQKARAVEMGGAVMYLPTAMFNAVFLPCHIAGHFVYGGMSLKQVVDWAAFVSRHHGEIDWTRVFELASGAGFLPLLKALNGIVVRYLGVGRECVPDDFGPERVMERVMEELFAPAVDRRSESYLAKACRFFGAKWKYDLVFRDNYYLTFFRRGWASFRGRHLKNSRNVWAN